jgi:hypothetical protein
VVTTFVRSFCDSLRRLLVLAVEQHASPVRAELIEHFGESISIPSYT